MRRQKVPDDLAHERAARLRQMAKFELIGYEHCSTSLIRKLENIRSPNSFLVNCLDLDSYFLMT